MFISGSKREGKRMELNKSISSTEWEVFYILGMSMVPWVFVLLL